PPGGTGVAPAPAPPVWGQLRAGVHQALAWWLSGHRHTLRSMWGPGRRASSVPRHAAYLVVDVLSVLCGLFLVAMIVSPFLGI
ncbi:MAG: hypothetical protein ACRDYY_12335, partial [Acidimicrobiales bacterium]